MPVGAGLGGLAGADIAARTRHVLDIELLPELLRQLLRDEAGRDIGWTAGRERDDHPHRPRRIGLRPGEARHRREGSGARGQAQESTTRRLHRVALRLTVWAVVLRTNADT